MPLPALRKKPQQMRLLTTYWLHSIRRPGRPSTLNSSDCRPRLLTEKTRLQASIWDRPLPPAFLLFARMTVLVLNRFPIYSETLPVTIRRLRRVLPGSSLNSHIGPGLLLLL